MSMNTTNMTMKMRLSTGQTIILEIILKRQIHLPRLLLYNRKLPSLHQLSSQVLHKVTQHLVANTNMDE
jgi:hypothetical protein